MGKTLATSRSPRWLHSGTDASGRTDIPWGFLVNRQWRNRLAWLAKHSMAVGQWPSSNTSPRNRTLVSINTTAAIEGALSGAVGMRTQYLHQARFCSFFSRQVGPDPLRHRTDRALPISSKCHEHTRCNGFSIRDIREDAPVRRATCFSADRSTATAATAAPQSWCSCRSSHWPAHPTSRNRPTTQLGRRYTEGQSLSESFIRPRCSFRTALSNKLSNST
ncbi:hypothetical protein BT67DRAFT_241259 [Trichocladium antarcticum]|uniref:Uncharacterized protein n=1 Tax=Trichocladium antarcticum TaxID=1450529 RepID=A0AAN6Z9I7_9PEZI|nr:hypothetical protein BT67DRAFT_241259 [Trichocladium antarcticum]